MYDKVVLWLAHLVSAMAAIAHSIRYMRSLRIQSAESVRYFKKALSLGLCYSGLGPMRPAEAWRAGQAAFLCCAYDVVTDWRQFDRGSYQTFTSILNAVVADDLALRLATGLYQKEKNQIVADDGLERGSIALRFILRVIGCEK